MLVPEDNQRVVSLQVTSASVRAALSLVLVLLIVFGSFTIGFFVKKSQQMRADRIERENLLLAAEVDEIRGKMEVLTESLDSLAAKDEKYRVIAGLPSIDPEVQQVGIGGPGTQRLESSVLYRLNRDAGEKVYAASYDLNTLLRRTSLLSNSMEEAIVTMEANNERLAATPSIAPSNGHLSSLFSRNRRHPVLRITRPHNGIDIAAPVGEPIHAAAAGTVVFAGWKSGGLGNTVEIDHGHGYLTRYAHASRVLVRAGQKVERGDAVAEVGATGLVSGPHLHYEVEVDGKPVDPLNFILEDAVPE